VPAPCQRRLESEGRRRRPVIVLQIIVGVDPSVVFFGSPGSGEEVRDPCPAQMSKQLEGLTELARYRLWGFGYVHDESVDGVAESGVSGEHGVELRYVFF
jgi:hypothetical protein